METAGRPRQPEQECSALLPSAPDRLAGTGSGLARGQPCALKGMPHMPAVSGSAQPCELTAFPQALQLVAENLGPCQPAAAVDQALTAQHSQEGLKSER